MNEDLQKAFETIGSVIESGEDEKLVSEITTKLSEYVPKKNLDIDTVKSYINENDAGKEYIGNLLSNTRKETINEYVQSEDYKNEINRIVSEATKQREEELRKELNVELTPEQKKIKELEEKQQETDKLLRLKEVKLEAANMIQEKNSIRIYLSML